MAAVRGKALVPVGAAQWIGEEREQVVQFCDQEFEDFAFSARNEVEWLNEHMAEIFSNNLPNVTEILKTPGKLRGKTPRTARKRNPLETRAPLTDIFSANVALSNSPSRNTPFNAKIGRIQFVQGTEIAKLDALGPANHSGKENFDSGYHGMSEDDMDVERSPESRPAAASALETPLPEEPMQIVSLDVRDIEIVRVSEERRTTEGSFHSARENLTTRDLPQPKVASAEEMRIQKSSAAVTWGPQADSHPVPESVPHKSPGKQAEDRMEDGKESLLDDDQEIDVLRSPSEGPSPAKPLVRKGSLTFASLPAREPLTTKKSIGARLSRTSHIDQTKTAALNRNSYLGRYTGGKSLGGLRQPEYVDEIHDYNTVKVDETCKPALEREESDGDGKIARLHNKSSTQRLHERINLLGQTQPGRPQKSIAAASVLSAQLVYPDLQIVSREDKQKEEHLEQDVSLIMNDAADDDDDWIKPPSQNSGHISRPQLAKSRSVDVMEQIRGKDSIGGNTFAQISSKKEPGREMSPMQSLATTSQATKAGYQGTLSSSVYPSMSNPSVGQEPFRQKSVSISNRRMPPIVSTTPAGTPPKKLLHDGPLNASKSKLQSIMKSARGLFTSSAGVSAQAKMETLSPSSSRLRNQAQEVNGHPVSNPPSSLNQTLYPSLPNGSQVSLVSNTTSKEDIRRTRSSTEKEERRKAKESKEREGLETQKMQAEGQERQKAIRDKAQQASADTSIFSPKGGVVQETAQVVSKQTRQSPRRPQNCEEAHVSITSMEAAPKALDDGDQVHAMGPPPARAQIQSSQIQKPKDMRRPVKPAKEAAPKPKPQPVAIRVGTLSQRIPLTNAALSSSLQESLPPPQTRQPTVTKKSSNASLQTAVSTTSFKSSTSSSISTKPKALIAAERKREQDEKEAQRKLEHKREIERKRLAQQEEAQRREHQQRQEVERQREKERAGAADDPRKLAQKQAIEKRRLEMSKKNGLKDLQGTANDLAVALQHEKTTTLAPTSRPDLGGGRPPSRLNVVQDFPRALNNYPAPNPAKPPAKRVFDPDHDDEPFRVTRVQGGQSYQQNEAKRRRTEDEDGHEAPYRPTMAPPIRQSNVRKDGPKASMFSNSYTAASLTTTNHGAVSSVKPSGANQQYQQQTYHNQYPRPAQLMEMAKYANGKIPFAEAPNPPPPTHKTPLPPKQGIAANAKSSPLFTNGEKIELEDIPTDSEEEDSDVEKERKKNLPEWVRTPNLDERLREQERLNPDVLFGPIAPLVMEEIFKDKNRHHRFRSRTSSANWFGQDRLTEEDVRADNAARERLRREGGWTFGL